MDALLQELKRRSEFWARCTAASKALEEVAGPVTQAYQQAREDREFIRKQLDETGVQLRQRRSWPPTSITLTAERREAETLERQWAAMKNEPVRVVNLVSTLSGLAARYQALADRVSQAAGRFDQEQQEVSKLEEELEEYRLGWEANLREYRSNEMAGEEINELLTSLDSEHKQIRQQYQNGAKTYDQVLQSLRQLIRKARVAQVQIDEQHAVDVHGGVITRREASLGDF
jgi:chromosome segregation ATPase